MSRTPSASEWARHADRCQWQHIPGHDFGSFYCAPECNSRTLLSLDVAISDAHQRLADTFAELHDLHHQRGQLLYLKDTISTSKEQFNAHEVTR